MLPDVGADHGTTEPPLLAALGTVLAGTAAPYGFTLALWSSGVLVIRAHRLPTAGDVFAFAAGGLLAYGLLAALSRLPPEPRPTMEAIPNRRRMLAGTLNWFSVGAAIGAVALLAHAHGWIAWPLCSFAATLIYLLCSAVQLAIVS